MDRLPRPAEILLSPASVLYGAVMGARNRGFDSGLLKREKVNRPVVSNGNITAGGTGKTPLTASLLSAMTAKGIKVGVVSRGYGGEERGPARVPTRASFESAWRFGDEPSWLASRFNDVPVFVGADRARTARALIEDEVQSGRKIDLVLADDAFQHRWLARDLDIVVVDATEPRWHYRALPVGRMREGFESLARAHAVVVTKCNLADQSNVTWLREKIAPHVGLVVEMESLIPGFSPLGNEEQKPEPSDVFKGRKVVLASGIGRPAAFRELVQQATGAEIVDHLIFEDHHSYTVRDFASIDARALASRAEAVLVTEKDAVKMSKWKSTAAPVYVSKLVFRARGDGTAEKELHEAIGRLVL